MANYPEKLHDLVTALGMLDERTDRIEMLIDIGGRFRGVPEEIARRPYAEDHKVPGCESQAYLFTEELPDHTLAFHFAVENPQGVSAMALAVILEETLSGAPPAQVAQVPAEIVYDLFGRHLSMGKSMGLMGMVNMVATTARRHVAGDERCGESAVLDTDAARANVELSDMD
jgi:cysteine desulfuration protein SufE